MTVTNTRFAARFSQVPALERPANSRSDTLLFSGVVKLEPGALCVAPNWHDLVEDSLAVAGLCSPATQLLWNGKDCLVLDRDMLVYFLRSARTIAWESQWWCPFERPSGATSQPAGRALTDILDSLARRAQADQAALRWLLDRTLKLLGWQEVQTLHRNREVFAATKPMLANLLRASRFNEWCGFDWLALPT